MITAESLRTQHTNFPSGLRGFHKREVEAYLGRLSLLFMVLDEDTDSTPPALPFSPDDIRAQDFMAVWMGYDRDTVHAYLQDVAAACEDRLEDIRNPPPAKLHLPSGWQSRVANDRLENVEIEVRRKRQSLTFTTADALHRDLTSRLIEGKGHLLANNIIVVPALTEAAMHAAIEDLDRLGQLKN